MFGDAGRLRFLVRPLPRNDILPFLSFRPKGRNLREATFTPDRTQRQRFPDHASQRMTIGLLY